MNKRSQAMLRDFATELPAPDNPYDDDSAGPVEMARMMVERNNRENGSTLELRSGYHQAPDHTWWSVAWVYDTGPAPRLCRHCSAPLDTSDPSVDTITGESFCEANPDFNRHETEHGGDVIVCWWQKTTCPGCEEGSGSYPIYDNRDAVIGHRPCEMTHPTCGRCHACQWAAKYGPYDEVTGKLSRPACTGPPPPVSLVKVHYCDDPNHCSPF